MKKNRIIQFDSIVECENFCSHRLAHKANLIYCKFADGSAWIRKNRWAKTGFVSNEEITSFIQLAEEWDKNCAFKYEKTNTHK